MSFDPYHKWLMIPKDQRPPTYYQLLGISPDEQDQEVIEEAVIQRTAHLRTYQSGSHAKDCARLLNEIAEARLTLLNSAKRKQYDATLAQRGTTAIQRLPPISTAPALDFSTADERVAPPRKSIKKRGWGLPKLVGGAVVLGLLVGMGLLFLGKTTEPKDTNAEVKQSPSPRAPERVLDKAITNSIGMKLVLVPKGEFMMGSPDNEAQRQQNEGPQHKVKITNPFYMGVYEVTQKQYEQVMGTNPSLWKTSPDHPVERVSWDETVAFCKKLSELPEEKKAGRLYRLPTEAEWEYACRAGTTTPTHFGASLSSTQANFNGNAPYCIQHF